MEAIIWVLVPLAAIIGSFIIKYQRNKMMMMNRSEQNEQHVEEVQKLMTGLKKRIENLEAIAAGAPDDFKRGAGAGMSEIEMEEDAIKNENRQKVSDIANKQRS